MAASRKNHKPHYGGDPAQRLKLLTEILSYTLMPDQAQTAAQSLLDSMGSISAILTAPQERVAAMPGMHAHAARLLFLSADLARFYMEEQAGQLFRVADSLSAVELFRPKFLGRKTEVVCVMLLNGHQQLIYNDILTEGSLGGVPLYIRRLIKLCIEYDAQTVLLAHNHPSGVCLPSKEDAMITRQLAAALMSIDARLRDHIIFAADGTFSFSASGILQQTVTQIVDQRRDELANDLCWAEQMEAEGLLRG